MAQTFAAARHAIAIAGGILLIGTSMARATEITFNVTGVVTSVGKAPGDPPFPFPNMTVGDPFSVEVSFDDAFPNPSCGGSAPPSFNCYFPDTVLITSGGTAFTIHNPSQQFSSVQVFNDTEIPGGPSVGDAIIVDTNSQTDGFNITHFHLSLIGNTNPLGSPTVPADPGSLSGWDPTLSTAFLQLQSMFNGGGSFSGSIDIAPEPTTLLLLSSGVVGLAAFGRSKRC
jgi:hypothetical protein